MSKTNKGASKKIRPKSQKMDFESKSEIKYKGLSGYYFDDESYDRQRFKRKSEDMDSDDYD